MPDVREILPTVTIALDAISPEAKEKILKRIGAEIDGADEVDAYFPKARDRLNDPTATGKITLPVSLLKGEVKTLIGDHIAAAKEKAKERKGEVHPHIAQTEERMRAIR